MSNENLTAELCYGTWTVADTSGNRWWPCQEAARLIAECSQPDAMAIRLCQEADLGFWK